VTGKTGAMTNLHFRLMALNLLFRDMIHPPEAMLAEAGVKAGLHVLDYGCGPGSYALPAAQVVGITGRVYALDVHPLAVQRVQRLAVKKGLTNMHTILSDGMANLPDAIIDVALCYDVFHELREPEKVLAELHGVLKPDGILPFSDHHLKEEAIVSRVTAGGRFKLSGKAKRTYTFFKV
jgi:ubiquinone/menaquinone biosynthesis C-methylase UbiE